MDNYTDWWRADKWWLIISTSSWDLSGLLQFSESLIVRSQVHLRVRIRSRCVSPVLVICYHAILSCPRFPNLTLSILLRPLFIVCPMLWSHSAQQTGRIWNMKLSSVTWAATHRQSNKATIVPLFVTYFGCDYGLCIRVSGRTVVDAKQPKPVPRSNNGCKCPKEKWCENEEFPNFIE